MMYRVYTPELMAKLHITDAMFVLGILGMILGSVKALRERHIKRMTAYSSVAQIGYIFMGLGLNSEIGAMAAVFHIMSHAVTKPMLFLAAGGLANVSGHSYEFKDLRGAAHRNKFAGVAFVIGALSMIGIPLFAGFPPKLFFYTGAIQSDMFRLPVVLIALAISTALNALYYLPVCINIWRTKDEPGHHGHGDEHGDDHGHGAEHSGHDDGHEGAEVLTAHVNDAADAHLHGGTAAAAVHTDTAAAAFTQNKSEAAEHGEHHNTRTTFGFRASMVVFIATNFALGIAYGPMMEVIKKGLELL